MQSNHITIRSINTTDIPDAKNLSDAAGWNQTENDWKFLIENPRNIGVVAKHNARVVGTSMACIYSNQLAWIGMVLVKEDFQGQGISQRMLNYLFERLDKVSIKLDATPTGAKVYRKFSFEDEYQIVRMVNPSFQGIYKLQNADISIEPLKDENSVPFVEFDSKTFGVERKNLIEFLLKEYPGKAWLAKRNYEVVGFALGRRGNRYHHIGPVMAQQVEVARFLISRALTELKLQPVVVDVLQDKIELIQWLEGIGFEAQRNFTRMYKEQNPFPGEPAHQYLICGPEFG